MIGPKAFFDTLPPLSNKTSVVGCNHTADGAEIMKIRWDRAKFTVQHMQRVSQKGLALASPQGHCDSLPVPYAFFVVCGGRMEHDPLVGQ